MNRPLAVYVHIPFCTVKCGYCDFNAYAGMDNLKDAYAAAMVAEVRANAPLFEGYHLASVGFGGGTPGEVPAAHITAVLDALRENITFDEGAEVTLEANPGTVTPAQFHALRRAGVSRLSLGAQSFDAGELRFLDRIHSPEATAAAVALARDAGFASVGLDLIYGLPGQTSGRWAASVGAAIALAPDHVSIYALTVEEQTPLARRVRDGAVLMPGEDDVATLYDEASDLLEAAGYAQYELSNFARPGHQSRHNRVYWTGGDYLAIGAGAHGFLDGERYENIAHPRAYIQAMADVRATPRPAMSATSRPGPATAMADWLSLRLRLLEGFKVAEFEQLFGRPLLDVAGPVIEECAAARVLAVESNHVRLTRRGRLLHGEVTARLTAHLRAVLGPDPAP